jgi:hypothetical protein
MDDVSFIGAPQQPALQSLSVLLIGNQSDWATTRGLKLVVGFTWWMSTCTTVSSSTGATERNSGQAAAPAARLGLWCSVGTVLSQWLHQSSQKKKNATCETDARPARQMLASTSTRLRSHAGFFLSPLPLPLPLHRPGAPRARMHPALILWMCVAESALHRRRMTRRPRTTAKAIAKRIRHRLACYPCSLPHLLRCLDTVRTSQLR